MRPSTDTARLAFVVQEKMTRSRRTSPVLASTFSAPKKCWRMAIVSALARWSSPSCAAAGVHDATPSTSGKAAHENLRTFTVFLLNVVWMPHANAPRRWMGVWIIDAEGCLPPVMPACRNDPLASDAPASSSNDEGEKSLHR